MPPKNKIVAAKRVGKGITSNAGDPPNPEVENLRRELAEARKHRDLLIHTVHGLATKSNAARTLSAMTASPSDEEVYNWLVQDIENLVATAAPVQGSNTLQNLMVPVPALAQDIDNKWFGGQPVFNPNNIPPTITVGDLAYSISQRLP